MTWQTPTASHRSLAADWKALRGRFFNATGLTHRFYGWFPDVRWQEMPSNQFAQPIEMLKAGWRMDQRRDDDGRLL